MAKWKRMTPEQIDSIRNAPATDTLADLAKRFGTSISTVQKHRIAKKAPQPKEAAMVTRSKSTLRATLQTAIDLPLSEKDLRVVVGSIVNG